MLYQNTENSLLTVERGMQVLRAFRSDRAALSNAQLVERTGLSKATVSRLTSTMMQIGFLNRVQGARGFEFANQSYGIGHAYIAQSEMLRLAHPLMQDLANSLNVSVALGVRDGLDILYIGYRVSDKVKTLRLGVGSVLPMGTTAIGRAYLSALDLSEQRALLNNLVELAGDHGPFLKQSIIESIYEIEQTGTCAVLGGFQRGSYAVALPINIGRKRTVMSLSCGHSAMHPLIEREKSRITPILLNAAYEMEELLKNIEEIL